MSYADLRLARALMDMRVEQAWEGGRFRQRSHLAPARQRGWLAGHGCRLLGRAGIVLVALGERLERYGLPPAMPSDRALGAGA